MNARKLATAKIKTFTVLQITGKLNNYILCLSIENKISFRCKYNERKENYDFKMMEKPCIDKRKHYIVA